MDTIWFQQRVMRWVRKFFGEELALDTQERNLRFLEKAIELVQARYMDREQAHKVVDYVFDRPSGFQKQEVAGTLLTLFALAEQAGINVAEVAYKEINRLETAEIKEKRKLKRKPKKVKAPYEAPVLSPAFFATQPNEEAQS